MLQRLRKWNEDQQGVTLIELMVVVAILAVIALVAVPMVTSSLADARNNTDQQNAKILSDAIARYKFDSGSISGLDEDDLVPKYIQAIPERANDALTCETGEIDLGEWCVDSSSGEVRFN